MQRSPGPNLSTPFIFNKQIHPIILPITFHPLILLLHNQHRIIQVKVYLHFPRFSFHRWLSELRGRAQQHVSCFKMDDATAEARREEILPGDLLQGIIPASYFDLSSCPVDATSRTLSNYFRARNFPAHRLWHFTVHRMPDQPVIDLFTWLGVSPALTTHTHTHTGVRKCTRAGALGRSRPCFCATRGRTRKSDLVDRDRAPEIHVVSPWRSKIPITLTDYRSDDRIGNFRNGRDKYSSLRVTSGIIMEKRVPIGNN